MTIKFGTESLTLDTWALQHQYTAMCTITGPGMTQHLKENDFIRSVFELGPKPVFDSTVVSQKQSKFEKVRDFIKTQNNYTQIILIYSSI